MNRAYKSFLLLFIISASSFLLYFSQNNEIINLNQNKNKNIKLNSSQEIYNPNQIVFFKNSSYNENVEKTFEFYGGTILGSWNESFNTFSGFYGILPLKENKTKFENTYHDNDNFYIESNSLIEAQMNYASLQAGAVNLSGFYGGYNGDTEASIALLDTGIDSSHNYLQDKVIESINFINSSGSNADKNGHGTFLASIISGNGTFPYNSSNPIQLEIHKNFSHSENFGKDINPANFSIKLCSFNISSPYFLLNISSSWFQINYGIDKLWIELYYEGELVNSSFNKLNNTYYTLTHHITEDNLGIYDLKVKYHKVTNKDPSFKINSSLKFFPEFYVPNYRYYTGLANASKLLNYKVLNGTGQGRVSNLISALEAVIQNRSVNKIISVCLSLGNYEIDTNAINQVIDEVANNGILVVIAAGNYGIDDFDTLNSLGRNKNAIVVGAINDKDQITSYSSMGKEINNDYIKPDIVAPGGSKLDQSRTIIAADAISNLLTTSYGTSISAAMVSAALSILLEAKWNNWTNWESTNTTESAKLLKNVLFMTATETNQNREDDPYTEGFDESQNRFSPRLYLEPINITSRAGLKDEHEGYGRLNIKAAIDALTKKITPNSDYHSYLSSSLVDPLGTHAYARQIELEKNHQYVFNFTEIENDATFDIYLYSNESTEYGEPILLEASRKVFGVNDYLYFTPRKNETNIYVIIKAINGEGNFTLNISEVENAYDPELRIPEITYNDQSKNTTVLSLSERDGETPEKNITLDRYKFYIEYVDNDSANVPPQQVSVHIQELSNNYTMTQINIADQNYTDGAIFESEEIELAQNRTYNYYFYLRDGEREAYYPTTKGENLSIIIEHPSTIKTFPYEHKFNYGLDNWSLIGTGWNILHQNNQNDNRSNQYTNNWNAVYFGSYHDYPTNYTYQPIIMDEFLNGTFLSPYFDLTGLGENMNPILKTGLRVSINEGDYIELLINVNGSGWKSNPLRTYTDIEKDWDLEEINLSDYIGNYIKFKFEVSLDENNDLINYKGFIIDCISIINYSNHKAPKFYFNSTKNIQFSSDLEYQKIRFSLNYQDEDNNYPEYVYIEIDNNNYTMVNIYGNWNGSYNSLENKGILFVKTLCLQDFSNYSFKFHISDGKYINSSKIHNQDNSLISFAIPRSLEYNVYQNLNPIGYSFNESMDNFYVCGMPIQKENTAWLKGDNSWHIIKKLYSYYLYGGMANLFNSEERGYRQNWEAKLITRPVKIISEKKVYLEYDYEIDLEFQGEDGGDKGIVSISTDYGETWAVLKNYTSNNENSESLDISQKIGNNVMFKFELITDETLGASTGYGWLLSNIYVGYDRSKDHIKPTIIPLNPADGAKVNSIANVQVNISDNEDIDLTKFEIRIDGTLYEPNNMDYNNETGTLSFDWNTQDYSDGWHTIQISAQDNNGNYAEVTINIQVDNLLINLLNWSPLIIIIIIGIILILTALFYIIRTDLSFIKKIKNTFSSNALKIDEKEDKIIEKIRQMETAKSKKSLILHCKYCDSWFYSDNFDIICPSCGRDQIYVAYKCLNCGKWYFEDEPGNYMCKFCEGVKLIRRNKEEMQEIIGNEYKKVLKEFEIKDSEQKII